jgi:hypothetical protein
MIPKELREYAQWVHIRERDKAPLQKNGHLAKVSNPNHWHAYNDFQKVDSKGFVLTKSDPYTIIDLDDPEKNNHIKRTHKQIRKIKKRQAEIIDLFDSYTELSRSGKGYHIIVKGKLKKNFKRDWIEAYSSKHYFFLTGNTINNAVDINERQNALDIIYKEFVKETIKVEKVKSEKKSNSKIIERLSAIEKFRNLFFDGAWEEEGYPSQSEADQALFQLFAMETSDDDQIKELFLQSALGQRKKAKRPGYLDYSIEKCDFSESVDTTSIIIDTQKILGQKKSIEQDLLPPDKESLVYRIADYIYHTSFIPMRESAISAALGFCAGVYGRNYLVSKDRHLNLYLLLLADTGAGKGGLISGVQRLLDGITENGENYLAFNNRLRLKVHLASGPAFVKDVAEDEAGDMAWPCRAFFFSEFSDCLKRWLNTPQDSMGQYVKDLYDNSVFRGWSYSDRLKNVSPIKRPAVSIIGEMTPHAYFENVNSRTLDNGMTPRFLHVVHDAPRVAYINPNHNEPPGKGLCSDIIDVFEDHLTYVKNNKNKVPFIDLEYTKSADALAYDFYVRQVEKTNSKNQIVKTLWNRAHLNVHKLAALASLGVRDESIITIDQVQWAIKRVTDSIEYMINTLSKDTYSTGPNAGRCLLEKLFVEHAKEKNGVTYVRKRDVSRYARTKIAFENNFTKKFDNIAFDREIAGLLSEGFCTKLRPQDCREIGIRAVGEVYRLRIKKK